MRRKESEWVFPALLGHTTYHYLVAADQRVIRPHSLKALFQPKAALEGRTLQTQGRGAFLAPFPTPASERGSSTLMGGLGTPPGFCCQRQGLHRY